MTFTRAHYKLYILIILFGSYAKVVLSIKKINSIDYGWKLLAASTLLTLVIPIIIKSAMFVCKSLLLAACFKVSIAAGGFLSLVFAIMLAIEFHQDNRMNAYYETQKNQKLDLRNGLFECQSCGNRTVKSGEKSCHICGMMFKDEGGVISTQGILARTSVIDTELKVLLSQNPNAVVINLGAGLDTRFFRLDNGTVLFSK